MEEKRFTLRLDAEIFELVKKQAEIHKRSIAKEIEWILEQHLIELNILNRPE